LLVGRRVVNKRDSFARSLVVSVSLQREGVTLIFCPVDAEAGLGGAPAVIVLSIGMVLGAAIVGFAVETIGEAVAVASTVAGAQKTFFDVSASSRNQKPLRILAILGDNVDHAVHGVRSPNSPARAANHFNAVDILHHRVLHFPVGPGQQGAVDAAAIDQDKHGAGEPAAESANSNGPFIGVDAGDFHAGSEPQRFGDGSRSGALDVYLSDDVNGGGRVPNLLWRLGGGADLEVAELLKAELLEGALRGLCVGRKLSMDSRRWPAEDEEQKNCGREKDPPVDLSNHHGLSGLHQYGLPSKLTRGTARGITAPICHSERSEESLRGFGSRKDREIPRSARNEKRGR
jgi:hypothetical protein